VRWKTAGLSLYILAEGAVVEMEKQPVLMLMKQLTFKRRLLHGMKRSGGGKGHGMQCGAQGSDSMVGQSRGGARRQWRHSPTSVRKGEEEAGWARWVEQAGGVARPTGPETEKNPFGTKIRFLNV
jgi:hypothetical protein